MKTTYSFILIAAIMCVSACATSQIETTEPPVEEIVTTSTETESNQEENTSADTVVIGTQTWSTVNLNTIVFSNGDTILQATSREAWVEASKNKVPAWCYHEADGTDQYGKLYNYWAVIDPRGLAPAGWRIPSDGDFAELASQIGAEGSAVLKSTSGWEEGGSGSNNSGFNALAGGYRNATGLCNPIGRIAAWWTTDEKSSGSAFGYVIKADDNLFVKDEYYKRSGLYVRCIR